MELLQSFAFESAEALLAAVAVAALIAIFWLGFGVRKIFSEAELARAEERLRETASALDGAKTELAATTNELAATHARLEASQSVIRRIERGLSDGGVLLRPLDPQAAALRSSASIPIIAVGNLKGGVGKTTLAANLGAYLGDQRRGDRRGPVLFIDLDFQGSLSSILSLSGRDALALEGVDAPGGVADLFRGDHDLDTLMRFAQTIRRPELSQSRFFDATFEVAAAEESLLFKWLLDPEKTPDPRAALLKVLSSPVVQDAYGAVVIDLPPRASLFAYAGLLAATDVVIATREDRMSTEAAVRFAGFLKRGRDEGLWPHLAIAGLAAVGVDPQHTRQSAVEAALREAAGQVGAQWGRPTPLLGAVPFMPSVARAAGVDFAYFNARDAILSKTSETYFSEIAARACAPRS